MSLRLIYEDIVADWLTFLICYYLFMSKNLKSTLKSWIAKIFKEENKTKRFLTNVANKITSVLHKESKNQLEDIIAEDLCRKIEEIKVQNK